MNPTETLRSPLAAGGAVIDALATRAFDHLADAFEPDATMTALLPRRVRECGDRGGIRAAFEQWFGDVDALELADSSIGRTGDLLALRWRVRVRGGPRFGPAVMVVEQHAFAALGASGRIAHLSLVCSGFWSQSHVTTQEELNP